MRRIALAVMALVAWPGLAGSAELWPMTGPQIEQALTGRTLRYYDGARQEFLASGRTRYVKGEQESWGDWAVRGDRYCSRWPPSDLWACYDMKRLIDEFRFKADDGSESFGTYAD